MESELEGQIQLPDRVLHIIRTFQHIKAIPPGYAMRSGRHPDGRQSPLCRTQVYGCFFLHNGWHAKSGDIYFFNIIIGSIADHTIGWKLISKNWLTWCICWTYECAAPHCQYILFGSCHLLYENNNANVVSTKGIWYLEIEMEIMLYLSATELRLI